MVSFAVARIARFEFKDTGDIFEKKCYNDKILVVEALPRFHKWSTPTRENAPWYQYEELGYNYRMSNVVAGVVRGQFPYLEEHIARNMCMRRGRVARRRSSIQATLSGRFGDSEYVRSKLAGEQLLF